MGKTTLNVSGMTCGHCEKAVHDALLAVDGVSKVVVSLETGLVEVSYDETKVTIAQLKEAVEDQGYDVA